ncbi:MAG: 4Fe-4S binding protein [Tissierellia bacterium]|jgi:NADH dehydrogenase/NADH:ubiquinone oxidoreductase subunit G|nr:2Fe-2S iron-sulfur cluster-binding protein [Bacillota bacterium]NLK58598.1 4Fe-4S binding protein [Tissierellia bacterium]
MDITLTIDGKQVTVPKGTMVIEAAKKVGINIPALCYDKELQIVAACRMCVVEIEGSRKLVTSCSQIVWEGMEVHTMSERVVQARKGILRLLLDNHPNDCLTCQKAGDCLLQQYAYDYDVAFRTHDGARRGEEEARFTDTSSPYILRDESKCILCGKCVRTCAQVLDRQVLSFAGRGFNTHISADADNTLEESTCVSCNRCVSVCPVGALIDRRAYEKKIRNWAGTKKGVKCRACDYGCNMEVHEDHGEVTVKARQPAGGRPLCLRGRLFTEAEHSKNLPKHVYKKVETKEGRRFVKTSWQDALSLEKVLANLPDPEDE